MAAVTGDASLRAAGARTRARGTKQRRQAWLFGVAMASPALLIYLIFVIYPLIRGAIVSLYQWDGLTPTMTWNGLRNYTNALDDPVFRLALRNTFQYAIGVTIAKNVLGLGLALLLNKSLRLRAFFRTAAFLPVMFSFVVCGVLWSWIFNPLFGLADHGLALIGIHSPPGWLSDPTIALWSVMWVDVWKWTGFHMVLFLAALQAVPQDLYDAAAIDGARWWPRLWRITIPEIRPVIALSVLLSLTGAFVANYDVVFVMTGGGPLNATQVALTYIVQTTFTSDQVGYANAMSMILLVLVAIVGAVQLRFMLGRRERARA
ncbi:MAG TPA: sugar ABC transporter permease [Streptosporangiaceae bacterium]|nr:sugar ABC transporter permease [Streptosporangiaceae bacterium]